jgi:RNA polymerase sigma-70 factor (ECF subfamily)
MNRAWSTSDLVDGVSKRQEEALTAFDCAFRPKLLSFARKRGLNREDAEDIVQEALFAAVDQIQTGRFEGRASVSSWIHSIFVNRCADIQRRNFHREKIILSSPDPEDGAAIDQRGGWGPSVADVQGRVRQALLALPPRERLVLLLNTQRGLTAREIAPLLRVGVKTTEGILTRARKAFRQAIQDDQETSGRRRLTE